jgi:hypothetical protein
MSEFAEEGFLSTAIVKSSQDCRKQHAEWFVLCESINRFSLAFTSKVPYHPDNRQEWLTAALFLRMISVFEAITILTERCMLSEARILLRALMETLFALRAVASSQRVAEEYYHSHLNLKLKALKKLRGYESAGMTYRGINLNKRIEELEAEVKNKHLKSTPTTEYLAKKAGLDSYYNTAYSVLSWTTHSSVLDIAHAHVSGKSDDYVESVHLSPQIEDVEKTLMSISECMVIALRSGNDLFKAGAETEIEDYDKCYKSLYAAHKQDA